MKGSNDAYSAVEGAVEIGTGLLSMAVSILGGLVSTLAAAIMALPIGVCLFVAIIIGLLFL